MNKPKFKAVYYLGVALFILGWALSMLSEYYAQEKCSAVFKRTDEPVDTVEDIRYAVYSETTDLIYVFYELGCCVNVYDTSGAFRWAVLIPPQHNRRPEFVFNQNTLLFSFWDTYKIDATSGELIEVIKGKEASEIFDRTDCVLLEHSGTKLEFTENGKTTVIVEKSPFTVFLQLAFGALVALIGAVLIITVSVVNGIRSGLARRRHRKKRQKDKT